MSGVFIVGTDTDIGKTFVTAGLYKYLKQQGVNPFPYKPIQSGGIIKNGKIVSGDIDFVCTANEIDMVNDMNSYCFETPVSPHLASEIENTVIDTKRIIKHYEQLKKSFDFIICEGAGGINVPIVRHKYYIYDLVKAFDLGVILVTSAKVGTLNHTLLSVHELQAKNIKIYGIVVNYYSDEFYQEDNVQYLIEATNIPVVIVKDSKNFDEAFKDTQWSEIVNEVNKC